MKRLLMQVLGVVLAVFATTVFAADEISFQKSTSIVSSRYGQSQQSISFEVTVANLNYSKQIYAHVNQSDGSWIDVPLLYKRSLNGNREVWGGTYSRPLNVVLNAVFAFKYVVNGQTYWDNNGSQNYSMDADSGNMLAPHLNVYPLYYVDRVTLPPTSNIFRGGVTVRNLGYNKIVRVHYTTDNWNTTTVAEATFNYFPWSGAYSNAPNPNQYGSEEWSFEADVGYTSTAIEYALEYVVNGLTYWDNNTGLNYRTTIVRE